MSPRTPPCAFANGPIPASAGIGLRFEHVRQVIDQRPAVGWLEIHAENFMSAGGHGRATGRQMNSNHGA